MRVRRVWRFARIPNNKKTTTFVVLLFRPKRGTYVARAAKRAAAWALGDAAYWAARAAAQAARAAGDVQTADFTDGLADDLVSLAEAAGHVIRR